MSNSGSPEHLSPILSERLAAARAGHDGDEPTARKAFASADGTVRASGLIALHRLGRATDDDFDVAVRDPEIAVRYHAARLSAAHPSVSVVHLLDDDDLYVAEMAAWAIGERPNPGDDERAALVRHAVDDERPLVREAAVAALGAIGHPDGLPAILHGCGDKPAIRRRAVLALAPFDGPEVESALRTALEDRDWQVRQNAEDMLQQR